MIAFDVMDESHSSYNIKQRILETVREFNLLDKIFSISLDNASANKKCIDYIRPEIPSTLNGVFLHIKCCAHIINLSAQKGLSQITDLLEPIRKIVKYLRLASTFRSIYKKLCEDNGLRPKKWAIDTPTKWNSIFKLLKDAIKYKVVITDLYNSDPSHQADDLDNGLRPKKWDIDTPTRSNSIFKLLKDAIKYKVVITDLYNSYPRRQFFNY